jgi:hypothetical protein
MDFGVPVPLADARLCAEKRSATRESNHFAIRNRSWFRGGKRFAYL